MLTELRRLGEKPVGRKTFGRFIFWATDDWANWTVGRHCSDGWAKCVTEEKLKTSDHSYVYDRCARMIRDENRMHNIEKYDQSISADAR